MGRHGGGSSSGGSSGGSSSSSNSTHRSHRRSNSSSGGYELEEIFSKRPFKGCYDRCYKDKNGKTHELYTTEQYIGHKDPKAELLSYFAKDERMGLLKDFFDYFKTFLLPGILLCLFLLFAGVYFGSKTDGNKNDIKIVDTIDILSSSEELELLNLFNKVYERSGMPILLYTDDFEWKEQYNSLEPYSEKLYYEHFGDESSLIVLFTTNSEQGEEYAWVYDVYCGDDTYSCFHDIVFDRFLDAFQQRLKEQNLCNSLKYSWNVVMDDLGTIVIKDATAFTLAIGVTFIGVSLNLALLGYALYRYRREYLTYNYFKENPSELSDERMKIKKQCNNCGTSNINKNAECVTCGESLELEKHKGFWTICVENLMERIKKVKGLKKFLEMVLIIIFIILMVWASNM